MRLIDFFDKGVKLDPHRPFLIDDRETRTFHDAQQASYRIAAAIHRVGVSPGAKIAVLSANSARAFECVLGVLRAGCVWIPVNMRSVVEETAQQLDHADVELLFYGASASTTVPQLRQRCPKIHWVVAVDGPDEHGPFLESWATKRELGPIDLPFSLDDVTAIPYTGGTTGKPKGVVHTHRSFVGMVTTMQLDIGYERPVFLVSAPMTHAAGYIVLSTTQMGACNIVLPGFDPKRVLQAIEHYRVTHLFLPPTAIYMLLAQPDVRRYDYSSLRYFLYAGAPIFVEKLREAIEVFGPVMCQGYAQTEALPNLTFLGPAEHQLDGNAAAQRRLASCGRETLLTRIQIRGDDDAILGPGERGEICAQSPSTMLGYYKEPELSAQTMRNGWLHTGDIGYFDDDGYLYLVDRKKDMIISGGFNVYPTEVEQVLARHPLVLDCVVIGIPDEKWGESVKAVIQSKPGVQIDLDEIDSFCRQHMSGIKVPKSYEIWEELPRSAVGKVLRRAVRERFWVGRSRNI